MRDAGEAAEVDIVLARDLAERAAHPAAQGMAFAKAVGEAVDRVARGLEQACRIPVFVETALELLQAVVERLDQGIPAVDVVDQVVLQIRVALDHPHIAQHLEQHACRTPGAARAAQVLDQAPVVFAEIANDDLPVGERRVVVGDLADALHFPYRRLGPADSGTKTKGPVLTGHRRILSENSANRGRGHGLLGAKGSSLSIGSRRKENTPGRVFIGRIQEIEENT